MFQLIESENLPADQQPGGSLIKHVGDLSVLISPTYTSDFNSERTVLVFEGEAGDMMSEWTAFKASIMKPAAKELGQNMVIKDHCSHTRTCWWN